MSKDATVSKPTPPSTTGEEPVSSKYSPFLHSPLTSLGVGILIIASTLWILDVLPSADLLADGQSIGGLGVFAVTFLGLVLAIWRFGLEDRQASAAERAAEAASLQARVAKDQLEVAREQAKAAGRQIELAEKQIEGTQALGQAAQRQEEIAGQQAVAITNLAAAATLLAETAEKQAGAAEKQAGAAEQQVGVAKQQAGAVEQQVVVAKEVAEAAKNHAVAAEMHAKAVRDRARIDDQSLLHERYRRAAEMLGNRRVQAVRIGGVDLLGQLAREEPKDFHVQVMRLFTSFVRHPVGDSGDQAPSSFARLRADVQAVLDVIGSRRKEQITHEVQEGFEVNLTGANLQGADLYGANLEAANLEGVYLEGANVEGARLEGARIGNATLASGPDTRVRGLSQEQLDSCSRETTGEPIGLNFIEPGLAWTGPSE